MSVKRSVFLICFLSMKHFDALGLDENPSWEVRSVLALFSALPKNYAAAWGEVYRCNHKLTEQHAFDVYGLPTALSVSGDIVCTPHEARTAVTICHVPVQIKWLRMRVFVYEAGGELFFKPFNTTVSIVDGSLSKTDLGDSLVFGKHYGRYKQSSLELMMKCARTGLEHLIACLRWAECQSNVSRGGPEPVLVGIEHQELGRG